MIAAAAAIASNSVMKRDDRKADLAALV